MSNILGRILYYLYHETLYRLSYCLSTGRFVSVCNSPTRNAEINMTEIRTGAGSRGWKTTAHGKGSLTISKPKNTPRDKQRLLEIRSKRIVITLSLKLMRIGFVYNFLCSFTGQIALLL